MRLLLTLLLVLTLGACAVVEPQIHSVMVGNQTVGQATDKVQIMRGGVAMPAGPGTTLEIGDEVVTATDAWAVLLLENGAVEVTVQEDTQLRISSIFVKLGEVFVRVKKKLNEAFKVESEYGVALVEGTEFIVKVGRDGRYSSTVLEGEVELRSATGSWPPVTLGAKQELSGRPGSPRQIRTLGRAEYNNLLRRVNEAEQVYRPGSAQLIVPDLVGLTEAQARRTARDQGIRTAENADRDITGNVRIGEIIRHSPLPGRRIRANSPLQLVVKAESTRIPKLTGQNRDQAIRSLRASKLVLGEEETVITGRFSPGVVVQQTPAAGTPVPVDSEVDLEIEGESVKVPTVTRLSQSEAEKRLANVRLQLGSIKSELSDSVTAGSVIKQEPAANTLAKPGSKVNLTVAERGVRVPALSGQTRDTAQRELSRRKLKLGRVSQANGRGEPGTIMAQNPRANTLVRPGGSVNITVIRTCRVPNVRESSTAAATAAIRNASLTPVVGSTGIYNRDTVYRTVPAAGTEVTCGSQVEMHRGHNVQ